MKTRLWFIWAVLVLKHGWGQVQIQGDYETGKEVEAKFAVGETRLEMRELYKEERSKTQGSSSSTTAMNEDSATPTKHTSSSQVMVGQALHLDLKSTKHEHQRALAAAGSEDGTSTAVQGLVSVLDLVASRHTFLARHKHQQSVARTCVGSDTEHDSSADSYIDENETDEPRRKVNDCLLEDGSMGSMFHADKFGYDYLPATAGMTLHIFQQSSRPRPEPSSHPHVNRITQDVTTSTAPNLPSSARKSTDSVRTSHQGRQHAEPDGSSTLVWERSYQLLEPVSLELGIPPKHYLDFAYTPVYYTGPFAHPEQADTLSDSLLQESLHGGQHRPHYSSTMNPFSLWMQAMKAQPPRNDPSTMGRLASKVETQEFGQSESNAYCTDLEAVKSESCKAVMKDDSDQESNANDWWKWWFTSFTGNRWWKTQQGQDSEYTMGKNAFAGGSHGQVWRGRRVCHKHRSPSSSTSSRTNANDHKSEECDEDRPLILKRLKVEQGYRLLEAGLREVYFGQWIQDVAKATEKELFTVYVDHFFRELPRAFAPNGQRSKAKDLELWIVFHDAGPSLRNYLYAPVQSAGGFVMYQHSRLWAQLRMTHGEKDAPLSSKKTNEDHHEVSNTWLSVPQSNATMDSPPITGGSSSTTEKNRENTSPANHMGRHILRSVLHQVLSAAALLHNHGIVHRDIKPSNVMCTTDIPLDDMYDLQTFPNIQCRLGDFSSGWDTYTKANLYTKGPSPAEQTDEYAPPESYIGEDWVPFEARRPQSYDSWSIGVLALEMLLGTPNVFSVDQRTTVLLTHKMKKEGATDEELQRALYLAALSQFCIYTPGSTEEELGWPLRHGDPLFETVMVRESCTLQDFHRALRARDPLGIGFDSSTDLLLHLIWQLLDWDPMKRMSATDALNHPFFHVQEQASETSNGHLLRPLLELEAEASDPRFDFQVDDEVHEFICPKCGRVFTDWRSCIRHANLRRHAKFCTYDRANLPTCINTHSMLPSHPTSGYCDLQGRRRTIEDFHSIHLQADVQFYGMFDGHTGNVASKYAASTLFERLMDHLPDLQDAVSSAGRDWKTEVAVNVSLAFEETHKGLLEALSMAPTMDQSGTTATAMLVTDDIVILSSLGDSRAVLSSTLEDGSLSAITLTVDHVASNATERKLVLERGGFVSSSGGIDRVNGTLAITRSIGDAALAPVFSRTPYVVSLKREEIQELCGQRSVLPCFVVLASDGLWDVISNEEAVQMVAEVVTSYESTDRVSWNNGGAFQEAAEVLAVDAYVRGSTDNIGVCVVSIIDPA